MKNTSQCLIFRFITVCKNGYFRGIETYNFVRDIVSRYESYKKKIKA